jgi:hypothetical protein
MMGSGRLDMTQMITARYELAKAVEAIAASGERSHGKITIKPKNGFLGCFVIKLECGVLAFLR